MFLQSEKPINEFKNHVSTVLKFKTFERSLKLSNSEGNTWSSSDRCRRLTISTLQKDNPIIWIKDWVLWHCRLYGVSRVILYDNGSQDQQMLIYKLRNLEPEVEVVFVHWDFPYGSPPYHYAQRGSLNHCRIYFNPDDKGELSGNNFCINLDIDEFLVSSHRDRFLVYLDSIFKSSFLQSVVFHQLPVTNILSENCESPFRCIDFKYVHKEINPIIERNQKYLTLAAPKYIYRFGSSLYNDVHHTKTIFQHFTLIEQFHFFLRNIPTKLKRRIWGWRSIFVSPSKNSPKPQYDVTHVSASDIYFFHFLGLTCKWSRRYEISTDIFNEEIHAEEKLIEELFREANLLES